MKTDKLFYRIFLSQPDLIKELLPEIPADCEFSYSAPVIKEQGLALDGLLTPIGDDLNLPLVILEAQMQQDQQFYGRYFAEIFLYLYQYRVERPWYGLLILPNRKQDLGSRVPYEALLGEQVKEFYLEDLKSLTEEKLTPNLGLLKLLTVKKSEAFQLAKWILNSVENEAELQQRLNLVEIILTNKFPQLTTEEILKMLDLKTADITQTRFYQEIWQEAQEKGLEKGLEKGMEKGLEKGLEKGMKEGRKDGLQEGRKDEAINLVMRLIRKRHGILSVDQEVRIQQLTVLQLEALAEAVLDFVSKSDLEQWLTRCDFKRDE